MTGPFSQAELDTMWFEYQQGRIPLTASRPMFPWEMRSGIDFAGIDRALTAGQAKATASLDQVRDVIITELVNVMSGNDNPDDAAAELADFAATQPPEVQQAIARSQQIIAATLADLYETGAADVLREASSQGLDIGDSLDEITADLSDFAMQAKVPGSVLWTRLTGAALQIDGTRSASVADVQAGLLSTPINGAYDLARQATNVAYQSGRKSSIEGLPAPKEIYASELLDGNTCTPCADIDGTNFDTLEDGLAAYPDAGVYSQCDGGDRCRGTLVVVYDTEADPQSE